MWNFHDLFCVNISLDALVDGSLASQKLEIILTVEQAMRIIFIYFLRDMKTAF